MCLLKLRAPRFEQLTEGIVHVRVLIYRGEYVRSGKGIEVVHGWLHGRPNDD
jgi:hypothetical protein